jgi:hypothetical protein
MESGARLRRVEGLPHQSIDGQMLVVVHGRLEVHLLSPTAARIWELLAEGVTVDTLVDRLVGEYEVEAAVARGDVESVLAEMREKGMVVAEE